MRRVWGSVLLVLLLAVQGLPSEKESPFPQGFTTYFEGNGAALQGDYVTAIRLYRQAAEQGYIHALYVLGNVYYGGAKGVPQDYAAAARWYRQAAEQGHVEAQVSLGMMYDKGQGILEDDAEAVRWYRMAAEQGYAYAQGLLGDKYSGGEGIPQDYVFAHMWYNLAAAQGDKLARLQRDNVAELMTPTQIAKAQQLAREWHKAHKK